MERKHIGRSRIRKLEVCISKGVVGSIEKRIWEESQQVNKGDGA